MKQEYDLICSLGGNCAAAHNLRIRNLRPAAYPFDWTYFTSEEAVYQLAEGFKNKFEKYMLKENLVELPINPSHPDKIQLKDTWGKMIWANHFTTNTNFNQTYINVKSTFDKRFKRLLDHIELSEKILFLFCTSFCLKPDSVVSLVKTLHNLYPNKEFQIKVVSFNCTEEEHIQKDNIELFYHVRNSNLYDFTNTNYEWAFLDNIKLSSSFKIKNLSLLKKMFIILCPIKEFRRELRKKFIN